MVQFHSYFDGKWAQDLAPFKFLSVLYCYCMLRSFADIHMVATCSELNCILFLPAVEQLELHLHFIDFNSGRRAVLSIDMSCLKWYDPLILILVFELMSCIYVYIYSLRPIIFVMYEDFNFLGRHAVIWFEFEFFVMYKDLELFKETCSNLV